ncbi:MAG: beta strand repeat-containing protein, partial [Candidatus Kapaibacterium sp.]
MNVFTGILQGKLRSALIALAVMIFAGNAASAQLCVANCFPTYAYGCMYIAAFTCNGTAYSSSACGTSTVGTTNNNTNQSFSATPGSTVTWSMTAGNYFGSYYAGYYTIFVDWTNNNTWSQVGGFAYMSVNSSGSFVVPAGTTAGPRRMRVLFSYYGYYGPCVYDYYGDCKDFTLNIGYNNDLALTGIGTSTAAPFAAGTNNILVRVTNNGLNPITAATVNYTITPSTGSPMSGTATFAGTIAPAGTSTITLASDYNFPAVGSATVTASVNTVNNTTDGNTSNNNASGLLGAGLNGVYTVGGASPDFVSPAQAAAQLTAGGTIGPVTFNIRPGTYTENMYIANIPGSALAKPVVFQSENGNKNSVIVQYSNTSAAAITGTTSVGGVPTLRLNNADYISFKNFTIASLNTAASSGLGVELIGATGGTSGCDNVTFDNMVFNGVASTSFTLGDVFFLSTSNGYHPNLAITNCTFNQASIPFYHTYSGTTLPAGIRITDNTFSNFGAYAMRLEGTDGATVSGNSWSTSSTALSAGVVFVNHNGTFNFRKNRVNLTINNGISAVVSGSRSAAAQGVFANNFIRVAGASAVGFAATGSTNAACLHNTILNQTAGSAYTATSGTSLSTVNNIFLNTGGGPAFTGASGNAANYNNYWSNGGVLAVWNGVGNSTMAGHRASSAQDANSSNVNVAVADGANNNLSLTTVDVNLYGIGSTSNGTFNSGIRGIVADDIFGTTRNRSEVFMGAHQIVPVISFNPAPPSTLTGCANQTLTISGNAVVSFGAQLSFTWQRNGAPLLDGVNGVSGASTGDLTITNAQPSLNGGDYVLRVTATGGADPLVSNIINVVVNAPIEINAHPASRVICRGNETSMAVVASGTILGYQWQKDGRDIAGATGPIYVVSNAGYDMSGRYRCVLSGTCGTTTVASNDAVVYVASNTLIGTEPETIGAAVGSTGYLTVEANAAAQFPGFSPQFQWYNGSNMLSDNGRISGTSTNQLTIRNMQSADINQNYYCVVTGVCGSQTSKLGGFYVSQITVQNQPANQEVCSGKDASLMVSASSNIPNVVYSYQWRLN